MNRLSVRQQDNPKGAIVHFRHLNPAADPAVGLHIFPDRGPNSPLNPLIPDPGAVGTGSHDVKVAGRLQGRLRSGCRLTIEFSAPPSAHRGEHFIVHGCAPTICYASFTESHFWCRRTVRAQKLLEYGESSGVLGL
ncbi:MAG: hypothetical protein RL030_2503 [Pseudomonadota bacterium]